MLKQMNYINRLIDYLLPDGTSMEKFNLTKRVLEDYQLRLALLDRNKENTTLLTQALFHDPHDRIRSTICELIRSNDKLVIDILKNKETIRYVNKYTFQSLIHSIEVTEELILELIKIHGNFYSDEIDIFDNSTNQDELIKIAKNKDILMHIRKNACKHIKDPKVILELSKELCDYSALTQLSYTDNKDIHKDALIYHFNTYGRFSEKHPENEVEYFKYILPYISQNDSELFKSILKLAMSNLYEVGIVYLIDYGIMNTKDYYVIKDYYNTLKMYMPAIISTTEWKTYLKNIRKKIKSLK